MRRALLGFLAAGLVAVVLAACAEDSDESRLGSSPTPSITPITTPIPLPLDGSVTGALTVPGERDLYSLVIDAPVVELDLDADTFFAGSRLDGRLVLYEEDGTIVRVIDDGTTIAKPPRMRDPFAVLELPAGSYFVAVEDAVGDGAATGFDYTLSARRITPMPNNGGETCSGADGAVLLTNLNAVYGGNILGNTDLNWSSPTTSMGCVGSPVAGDDRVYRAHLTSGVGYQMVTTSPSRDGAFYVMTGCTVSGGGAFNLSEADQVCRAGGDGTDGADGVVFRPLVTGTYFLIVDGVTAPSEGTFRLHVRTLP